MIVDSHVHINSGDAKRYPPGHDGGEHAGEARRGALSAEGLLSMMDEAGVARAVIVHGAHLHGYDNSYSADSVAAHPARFAGVCVIDVTASDAPDKLEYWVGERGMDAVRLFDATTPANPPLDDVRSIAVIKRAQALDVPVTLVTLHERITPARAVFTRFPGVHFILDHLARFPVTERPPFDNSPAFFDLAELPNVSLKYSTVNQWAVGKGTAPARDYFKAIVDRYGPSRLMWGSNQPVTRYKPYPEAVRMAAEPFDFLNGEERAAIMGGNAARWFWPQ